MHKAHASHTLPSQGRTRIHFPNINSSIQKKKSISHQHAQRIHLLHCVSIEPNRETSIMFGQTSMGLFPISYFSLDFMCALINGIFRPVNKSVTISPDRVSHLALNYL